MSDSTLMSLNRDRLDKKLLQRYLLLQQPEDKVEVTYIWIDSVRQNMRSKVRTLQFEPKTYKDVPLWEVDGKTTCVVTGPETDICIKPAAMFRDPFTGGKNKLVLCETYTSAKKPTGSNYRYKCKKTMDQVLDSEPWFGMEQEYIILNDEHKPYGWSTECAIPQIGPHTCAVGADKVFGRDIAEAHYHACLYAGIEIWGFNAEIVPSHWEFQVGPCVGIDISDHLWVARYILLRIAEDYGVLISFESKVVAGNWGGCTCNTNFSTKKTRADGGIKELEVIIKRLQKTHLSYLEVCDADGQLGVENRYADTPMANSFKTFIAGVCLRKSSIRIPLLVADNGKGFLEDRRPSANCDPYRVTENIVHAALMDECE